MRPMPDPSELDRGAPSAVDLTEALARLDEHLGDPDRVREDLAQAGGRLRTVSVVVAGLAAIAVGLAVYASKARPEALPAALIITFLFTIFALALVGIDLSMARRGEPSAPDVALRSYLRALAIGRFGYAWAALAPTARERRVSAPSLGDVATASGEHDLSQPEGLGAYARTFARASGGHMRSMALSRVATVRVSEDEAVVEATLVFQSWPRWVSILMGLGFVLFRLLGPVILVAVIAFLIKRKRHERTIAKTLLRGRDGGWYVADADILEGASPG